MTDSSDTTLPRAEILDLLSGIGGPDAAVNWLCAAIGASEPPPILDTLARALRDGRRITVRLDVEENDVEPGVAMVVRIA